MMLESVNSASPMVMINFVGSTISVFVIILCFYDVEEAILFVSLVCVLSKYYSAERHDFHLLLKS